ncbi:MAG: ferrous iron transport protein A [Sphaerochaetaceae bacterium]|nr:ferrous iron transport protein A [Sphaerochaetaceae bacterium]
MLTLDKARTDSQVEIVKVNGEKATKRRLLELGILPGTEIRVNKVAPLGDPIELTVKNSQITIRKKDAANVVIVQK